jgi:hypothetical protein
VFGLLDPETIQAKILGLSRGDMKTYVNTIPESKIV